MTSTHPLNMYKFISRSDEDDGAGGEQRDDDEESGKDCRAREEHARVGEGGIDEPLPVEAW